MSPSVISLFFLGPLFLATCSLFLPSDRGLARVMRITGLAALSLFAISQVFAPEFSQSFRLNIGGWPDLFSINFVYDPLSKVLIAVSGLVFLTGALFCETELKQTAKKRLFWPSFFCLLIGVNGALLTADLFNLFVFFEVLLISTLGLLIAEGSLFQRKAALIYLALKLLGSIVFLLAIGVVYAQVGSLHFESIRQASEQIPSHYSQLILMLLLFTFVLKSGLFPLYFWLPHAYPQLPAALGGVIGGILTKVGLYAILRVFFLFERDPLIFQILMILAIASMLIGVFSAYAQSNMRSILSLHIVSQVGYIAGGIALVGLSNSPVVAMAAFSAMLFYFVHNILAKSSLFFSASWIRSIFSSTDLDIASGLKHRLPVLSLFFAIAALSLAGLPPFSGFWAKFSLIHAAFDQWHWAFIVAALVASVFTFLSMLKIWMKLFLGKPKLSTPLACPRVYWILSSGLVILAILFLSFAPSLLYEKCRIAAEVFFGA